MHRRKYKWLWLVDSILFNEIHKLLLALAIFPFGGAIHICEHVSGLMLSTPITIIEALILTSYCIWSRNLCKIVMFDMFHDTSTNFGMIQVFLKWREWLWKWSLSTVAFKALVIILFIYCLLVHSKKCG